VQAEAAVTEAEREERTATANHLFSLAAALGNAPGINTTVTAPGTFAVKRHWGWCVVWNGIKHIAFVLPSRAHFQKTVMDCSLYVVTILGPSLRGLQ
jgi:hypothetical protein